MPVSNDQTEDYVDPKAGAYEELERQETFNSTSNSAYGNQMVSNTNQMRAPKKVNKIIASSLPSTQGSALLDLTTSPPGRNPVLKIVTQEASHHVFYICMIDSVEFT